MKLLRWLPNVLKRAPEVVDIVAGCKELLLRMVTRLLRLSGGRPQFMKVGVRGWSMRLWEGLRKLVRLSCEEEGFSVGWYIIEEGHKLSRNVA